MLLTFICENKETEQKYVKEMTVKELVKKYFSRNFSDKLVFVEMAVELGFSLTKSQ